MPSAIGCRAPRHAAFCVSLILAATLPHVLTAQGDASATESRVGIAGPSRTAMIIDTGQGRPRVAMLSDGYYTRLQIHRIASYAAFPVMAIEYVLGEKLIHNEQNGIHNSGGLVGAHVATALALTGIFGVNTITGALNLYEARHQSAGRARRIVHSLLLLGADAGFAYTAAIADQAGQRRNTISTTGANSHRRAAVVSISLATVGSLMMFVWKN